MAEVEFLDQANDTPSPPGTPSGEELVDESVASPVGVPCVACGFPIEPLDKFCPACGTPHILEASLVVRDGEPPEHKYFRCENCGSEVATDPDQRSYVCPFCDSTYVVEFSPDQTNRESTEFIIGFSVSPEQAEEVFFKWLGENGWFRPGNLKAQAASENLKGVYLPFWSFSMLAESEWSATIGEYWYRTETYTTRDSKGKTVTRTRRVQETEWWPLSGRHHRYHSGYMVSGSSGLPQSEANRIKPFNLPALKRYAPYFLAGWMCEEYSVNKEESLQVCLGEFRAREQRQIGQFVPGDTHRELQVSSQFSNINSDLCLLPIYIRSYRYQDKLYRFMMNGQTGKCAGDKPVSWKRIVGAVAGAAALIGLVGLLAKILVDAL